MMSGKRGRGIGLVVEGRRTTSKAAILLVALGVFGAAAAVAVAGLSYPPPQPNDVTGEPVATSQRDLVKTYTGPLGDRYDLYAYASTSGLCLDLHNVTAGITDGACGLEFPLQTTAVSQANGEVSGGVNPEAFSVGLSHDVETMADDVMAYGITLNNVAEITYTDIKQPGSGQTETIHVTQDGVDRGSPSPYKYFLGPIEDALQSEAVILVARNEAGAIVDQWTAPVGLKPLRSEQH